MARPVPTTILESYNEETDTMLQINEAEGIFCIFYKGKPLTLLQTKNFETEGIRKYLKICWTQSGHAFRAVKKLNNKFDSEDFTVVKVTEVKRLSDSFYGIK